MLTVVNIGSLNDFSTVKIASRSVWDEKTDKFTTAEFYNKTLYAVAMIYTLYTDWKMLYYFVIDIQTLPCCRWRVRVNVGVILFFWKILIYYPVKFWLAVHHPINGTVSWMVGIGKLWDDDFTPSHDLFEHSTSHPINYFGRSTCLPADEAIFHSGFVTKI